MMSKIFLISCFLFSFSLFAQQEETKRDSIHIPISLFAMDTFYAQDLSHLKTNLNLFEQLNFKKLGRKISFDGVKYNYQKTELNKHFFKGDEIWNVSRQKEACQD